MALYSVTVLLLLAAWGPSFVLSAGIGGVRKLLLNPDTIGLTRAEAEALVGVYEWQAEHLKFFSLDLMMATARRDFRTTGEVDSAKAFESGFSSGELERPALGLLSKGLPKGAPAVTGNASWCLVVAGADPTTGVLAGVFILADTAASPPVVYDVREMFALASKDADRNLVLEGNDNAATEFVGIATDPDSFWLNIQVRGRERSKAGSYLVQAVFSRIDSWTPDAAMTAAFDYLKNGGKPS